MRAICGPTMGGAWVLTAVWVASACHPTSPRIRSEGLARQLQEVALTAERDSLLLEVVANGKLLTDIQAELARVTPTPPPGTPESPALEITRDQREFALARIREITTRLKAAETRLAASERRARRLTQTADSLRTENTQARATLSELVTTIGTQREMIAALTSRAEGLTVTNGVLADSVFHLTDAHHTAYFVVGTRAELIARGVIVADGHRAVPFVGRRTVQPARTLPLGAFTSINWAETRRIPLPRADRSYTIVSRQNVAHLAGHPARKGRVQGTIDIAAPEKFWEPSRYLIVVER